jgi:hypothetical protein
MNLGGEKVPRKNPHCPICYSRTHKVGISKTDPRKWIFECNNWNYKIRKYERHRFEDFP